MSCDASDASIYSNYYYLFENIQCQKHESSIISFYLCIIVLISHVRPLFKEQNARIH